MGLDVIIEDPRWERAGLETLANRAFEAVAGHLGWADDTHEVALLACDDARIADLNTEFRGKPSPTNVLSWPSVQLDTPIPMPDWEELGDLAIAFETCNREADEQAKRLPDHVQHLLVHGLLHLLGFDHEEPGQAAEMEALEVEILAKMGIANPY